MEAFSSHEDLSKARELDKLAVQPISDQALTEAADKKKRRRREKKARKKAKIAENGLKKPNGIRSDGTKRKSSRSVRRAKAAQARRLQQSLQKSADSTPTDDPSSHELKSGLEPDPPNVDEAGDS